MKKSISSSKQKENPFDTFANSRKKHEVVNRRVKGEDRNVGRALSKSIEERKTKLLADYKTSKKSNTFSDRRFGEQDADLSLEDKMFMRFQRERQKRIRNNGSQFNLSDAAEEILTHKGKVLGESNFADNEDFSDDNDEDDVGTGNLDRQVVNSLHFGGGLVQSNRDSSDGYKMGKLDALQEIVMKSKLMKLQKKETKLAQEEEREKLDQAFQELMGGSMLDMKPMKRDRFKDRDYADIEEGDEYGYNQSLQAMATEVKAKPADRTKSDEEIAVEMKARLEKLEAERMKRMKSTYNPDEAAAEDALGGKRKRHEKGDKKQKSKDQVKVTDDCVDNTFGAKVQRVDTRGGRLRVGGDDDDFGNDGEDIEDEEWEEDDIEGEMDDDGDNDDNEDGEENDDDDEADEDEDEEDGEEDDEDDDDIEDDEDEDDSNGSEGEAEDDTDFNSSHRGGKRYDRRSKSEDKLINIIPQNDKMPQIINCPADVVEFYDMIEQYTTCAEDVSEMINRIVAWHSVHLPGAEGVGNRVIVHNFLDILLKHFVRVADTLPFCGGEDDVKSINAQLNHLSQTIFQLCTDISDVVGALWGRTLKIFLSQLQKKLRDYVEPTPNHDNQGTNTTAVVNTCWPPVGRLLLLKLAGLVFATTDYRHAIIGPIMLFLCQCLTQCPVATISDVASGLLCVSILTDFMKDTDRIIPECLTFLRSVVALYIPVSTCSTNDVNSPEIYRKQIAALAKYEMQSTLNPVSLSFLRQSASQIKDIQSCDSLPWHCFDYSGEQAVANQDRIASSILEVAYRLLVVHEKRLHFNIAYPEIMKPIIGILRAVRPHQQPHALPVNIQESHCKLLETLQTNMKLIEETRQPLQWRKAKLFVIESKNPRYQVDYKLKKEKDPDTERVKLKQLTRDKKREHKAAMRELRRDSDFLEQERFKEKRAALEAQRNIRHKNFAWMEEQQATVNQQVRKGQTLLKGGGSGIAKKARVKR